MFVSSISNEKRDLEDVVKRMTGGVDMYILHNVFKKSTHDKSSVFIKNKIKECKFKQKVLWFSEELLCWRDRKEDNHSTQGRIWMSGITDMKIYEKTKQTEIYFYFFYGSDLVILKFCDEASCRSWSKAICYQNFKSQKKTSKIVFENYEAISPDQKYEEFFKCDNINYDYVGIKYEKLIDFEMRKFN